MMNVLVAIDGSEAALQACRLVAEYAGDRSALRVTLLNVQRPALHVFPTAGLQQPLLEQAQRGQAESELEKARAVLEPVGLALESVIRIGPPADTILEEAGARGPDVLVMGGGRQGPIGGYAIGSVALRVAPAARCPVLLVGAGSQLPAGLGKSLRVTMPVDGSAESTKAVERLTACAGVLGRLHVDLVHFAPGLSLAAAILPPHDDVVKEWGALDSDDVLARAAGVLSAAGIAHESHRVAGPADVGVASFAQQHGAELIAMATRGRGAMHHLLMGSVALRTAHASHVPVALLR